MKSNRGKCVPVLLLALAVCIAPLKASLIGIAGFGVNDVTNINPATGIGTLVGSPGFSPGSLASNAAGTLYTVDNTAFKLDTINPLTGASSFVTNITGFTTPFSVSGLAFSPIDGTLFASLEITGLTETDLYTIDPSTGVATKKGVINTGCCVADIAFSLSGTLFGWNLANATGLETINTTSGAGTPVNPIIGTTPLGITALTFDSGGNLLGALTPGGAGTSSLYSINTTTGTPTLIGGPIGAFGTSGIAFTAVPEPASALPVGSALLAVWIVLSRRTRRN